MSKKKVNIDKIEVPVNKTTDNIVPDIESDVSTSCRCKDCKLRLDTDITVSHISYTELYNMFAKRVCPICKQDMYLERFNVYERDVPNYYNVGNS